MHITFILYVINSHEVPLFNLALILNFINTLYLMVEHILKALVD